MAVSELRVQSMGTRQILMVIGISAMAFSVLLALLVLLVIPAGLGYLSGLAFITLSFTFLCGSASLLIGKLVAFARARKT